MKSNLLRRIFWMFNKFFMTPLFRMGLGAFFCNPFSGYIMVMKTIGRKSGKARFTPVNYAIMNGCVYCLAGWGQIADWYRNLKARPEMEVILPGGALSGKAEDVTDTDESLRAMRQILKNSGFAGFFLGFNLLAASDEVLRERTRDMRVIRICPTGIGSGASDPGGWMWIWVLVVLAALIIWVK